MLRETLSLIDDIPTQEEQSKFRKLGLELDDYGRPLHPWRDRLSNLDSGKGFYWRWGPNYTADPIIISRQNVPKLLLIQRGDSRRWALPGGFVDSGESAETAAIRELEEEANVITTGTPEFCYAGPVLDSRATLNAWSDTTALLWRLDEESMPSAGDDAIDAKWVPLRDLRTMKELHGSHQQLIELTIHNHGTVLEKLEYYGEQTQLTQPDGGHMGYERFIASLPTNEHIFIKRHDDSKFTDADRAQHSREYLRKEAAVYEWLRDQGVDQIPSYFHYNNDSLVLEGLREEDGWHWRVPNDPDLKEQYIKDVLSAAVDISRLTHSPQTDQGVRNIHQSFELEGWQSIHDKITDIRILLNDFGDDGKALANDLDRLIEESHRLKSTPTEQFSHHDFRQSNIAWHPDRGVRIVDWSWAGPGFGNDDTTSFLIDIAKSGNDIDAYSDFICPDHALRLLGFWICHAVAPAAPGNHDVRKQQMLSAITAHRVRNTILKTRAPAQTAS